MVYTFQLQYVVTQIRKAKNETDESNEAIVKSLIERVQSGSLYSRDTATGRYIYSSEKRGLCLMKCSSEMLQNLPYFWNMKTYIFFHFMLLYFSPN